MNTTQPTQPQKRSQAGRRNLYRDIAVLSETLHFAATQNPALVTTSAYREALAIMTVHEQRNTARNAETSAKFVERMTKRTATMTREQKIEIAKKLGLI